jgi:hypothetical protein
MTLVKRADWVTTKYGGIGIVHRVAKDGLSNIRRLPEPIPAKGQQGLWNWEPPEDWKCPICGDFEVGGGLCLDCQIEQTEYAFEEGLI